jgi:hypothetical protein
MAKAVVTISTLPEQPHNNNINNINLLNLPEQPHNININYIKLPKVKMHYTSPIKIIPLPFAFLE